MSIDVDDPVFDLDIEDCVLHARHEDLQLEGVVPPDLPRRERCKVLTGLVNVVVVRDDLIGDGGELTPRMEVLIS